LTTQYQYDAFGNVIVTTDPKGIVTYNFYDSLDRLVMTVDGEGYATQTGYNVFGEMTSVTRFRTRVTAAIVPGVTPVPTPNPTLDETTTITRDNLGQITKDTDAAGFSDVYTYDAFGDRASWQNKLSVGAKTTYAYDNLGRMTSEVLPESSIWSDGSTEATSVTNT